MKKLLLTFICCLTFLLYIPFNTLAIEYNEQLSELDQITDIQLAKINELFINHNTENLVIFYNFNSHELVWSFDIIDYNSSNKNITTSNRFFLQTDGTIRSVSYPYNNDLSSNEIALIYLYYNNNLIFKNPNLIKVSDNENTLLLSTSYENIIRSQSTSASASNRTRFFSYVDYDIRYTIKGSNFDVYYLVDDTYKIIQSSINSFTLITHESKSKFKDSSIQNDFPDYPTIPDNKITTYKSQFKHGNFLFKVSDLNSQNIIVKAPDTDKLLSDGNTNSQSTTTNNNQSNQLLENTINQMDQLENNYKSELNNNLNNINANDFNISGITQLSNAANFVRVQFDNLTKNNPFGTILGFSLFLGLSLLIIGKRL